MQVVTLRPVCSVSSGFFDALDAVNDHAGNNDALFYFASLKLTLLYAPTNAVCSVPPLNFAQ